MDRQAGFTLLEVLAAVAVFAVVSAVSVGLLTTALRGQEQTRAALSRIEYDEANPHDHGEHGDHHEGHGDHGHGASHDGHGHGTDVHGAGEIEGHDSHGETPASAHSHDDHH